MKTMTPSHPVEEAKKHTSAPKIAETTIELDKQIAYLKTDFGTALPVESANRESVTAQVAALEQRKNDRAIVELFPNARIFHPEEPLSWRNKDRMPVLAPFGIDSPTCEFAHEGLRGDFAKSVTPFYKDALKQLYRRLGVLCEKAVWLLPPFFGGLVASHTTGEGVGVAISAFWFCTIYAFMFVAAVSEDGHLEARHYIAKAVFHGFIPKPARAIILKAKEAQKENLFREIFLLAEVPEWEIALDPRPALTRNGDPLIIAFDGEKLWLLDSFNVTSVEMMAAGYTSEPPKF